MDSFSVLPDEVLVHIISFLDTKGYVSTSILAKRWRFLWARVGHLYFFSEDYRPGTRERLSSIINRALFLHRGYTIVIFSFWYKEKYGISNSELETMVAALIACNVHELSLLLECDVKLPRYLFTCKTLVKLDLMYCGDIPATSTVYLPALKILALLSVYYESDESLSRLLSGCPVLEELTVQLRHIFRGSISSPTVKKFQLRSIFDGGDDEDEGMDRQRYISIGTLTSLVEADIEIHSRRMVIGGDIPYFRYVVKLVGKVCDVKCLKLSTRWMMEVPDSAFSDLTIKFHNLTKLHLDADLRFVTKFLESADNLQDLTISTSDSFCFDWVETDKVASCLVSRVGIVRFYWFGCDTEQEFKMIRYILRNAMVLKRMTIHMHRRGHKLEAVHVQKIRSFERGSEACEIAFD